LDFTKQIEYEQILRTIPIPTPRPRARKTIVGRTKLGRTNSAPGVKLIDLVPDHI